MAEPLPPPSLARAREQKISELSTHFANDDLTLEDLERRIERVYKATNVVELEAITADLRGLAPLPQQGAPSQRAARKGFLHKRDPLAPPPGYAGVPATIEPPSGRILALMSSTRRVGRWAVPRKLDIL